jgi:hypothetical protein
MAIQRKSWDEFRKTGLFHFVNAFLHMFGYVIVLTTKDNGEVDEVYPARTNWRGFSEESNTKAYNNVTAFLQKEYGVVVPKKARDGKRDIHMSKGHVRGD